MSTALTAPHVVHYPPTANRDDFRIYALGRNGHINVTALEVSCDAELVRLTPHSSRGLSPSSYIEMPNDPAVLRSLAHQLLQLANDASV